MDEPGRCVLYGQARAVCVVWANRKACGDAADMPFNCALIVFVCVAGLSGAGAAGATGETGETGLLGLVDVSLTPLAEGKAVEGAQALARPEGGPGGAVSVSVRWRQPLRREREAGPTELTATDVEVPSRRALSLSYIPCTPSPVCTRRPTLVLHPESK